MSICKKLVLLGLGVSILTLSGCASIPGSEEVADVPLDVAKYSQPEEVWQAVTICRPTKGSVAIMTDPISQKWLDREFAERTLYIPYGNTTVTGRRESSRVLVCDSQRNSCREFSAIVVGNRYAILGKREALLGKHAVIISGDARSVLFPDGQEVMLKRSIFGKKAFSRDPLGFISDNRNSASLLRADMVARPKQWRKIARAIDRTFTKEQKPGETIGGCNRLATAQVAQFAGVMNMGDFKERYLRGGGGVLSTNDILSHGATFAGRQALAIGHGIGGQSTGLHAERERPVDQKLYEH